MQPKIKAALPLSLFVEAFIKRLRVKVTEGREEHGDRWCGGHYAPMAAVCTEEWRFFAAKVLDKITAYIENEDLNQILDGLIYMMIYPARQTLRGAHPELLQEIERQVEAEHSGMTKSPLTINPKGEPQ